MTQTSAPARVVLVVVDQHEGSLVKGSLEVLTAARGLGEIHAVVVGRLPDPCVEVMAALGAHAVHQLEIETNALAPQVAHAVAEVAELTGAATVLLSSSSLSKEVAALVAHRLEAGLVVDAVRVGLGPDGQVGTTQHAFASTWTVEAQVTRRRAVITLKANAVEPTPVPAPVVPAVRHHTAAVLARLPRTPRVVSRVGRLASDRPDLADASVVVTGGRGTNGDFRVLHDLAEVLGGAVGSTRVATDQGWIGQETQIGQTGVTVAPKLYIGAGVSGAVHHRGGMQASGTVVAVNSDPEAPIFEFADFGVVGDLFRVIPQLTAELRRLTT